mgnify:CR=1 FL=1
MRLVRHNPLNTASVFRNTFDDFFTNPEFKTKNNCCFSPAVDIVNREDSVELNVELPGMSKEAIFVNIEDNVLTISGERKFVEE